MLPSNLIDPVFLPLACVFVIGFVLSVWSRLAAAVRGRAVLEVLASGALLVVLYAPSWLVSQGWVC